MLTELWIKIFSQTNTKTIHQLSILNHERANFLLTNGVEILNKYLSYRYKNFTLDELIYAGYFNERCINYIPTVNNRCLNIYGKLKDCRVNNDHINKQFPNSIFKDRIVNYLGNYYLLNDGQIVINNEIISGKYLMFDTYPNKYYALTTNGEVINLKTLEKIPNLINIINILVFDDSITTVDRFGYIFRTYF